MFCDFVLFSGFSAGICSRLFKAEKWGTNRTDRRPGVPALDTKDKIKARKTQHLDLHDDGNELKHASQVWASTPRSSVWSCMFLPVPLCVGSPASSQVD